MEERKHIDRLYQEKFKDFEATPREAVWNNISSRLQEKQRKRRVIPMWYRVAGIAAVLALLFNYATDLFRVTTNPGNARIVTTEQERTIEELSIASSTYNENMLKSSIILQALMQDTRNKEVQEVVTKEQTPATSGSGIFAGIIKYPEMESRDSAGSRFTQLTGIQGKDIPAVATGSSEEVKMSIQREGFPEAAELPEGEEIAERSMPSKRLRVTTNAAPVYFDNLGKGSAIDVRFANNESSGEVSMSYGINLAYQLTEKLSIRSGISKLDLSHNTNNISFTATVNPSALAGIDYRGEVPKYRIENTSPRPFSNISASTEFNPSSLAAPAAGYLNQRLGFIEVPLEVEYVIIDKKVGLHIVGGGSTFFLDENMISLNSSNFSTDLGQANNLNSVSFSTNIGVGVDYKISSQFQLNLEPILKYQINTFSNNTNLNSYFFGVYSGFSFKF